MTTESLPKGPGWGGAKPKGALPRYVPPERGGQRMLVVEQKKVFVAHERTGVRVIPLPWLEAWRWSGFREATPSEVLGWYDERDVEPPAEVLRAVAEIAAEAAEAAAFNEDWPRAAITLPG